MTIHARNRIDPTSLSAQIKDAEQQMLDRRRKIGVGTAALTRKVREQMVAPTTFLFAAGIGFLIGEITKREPSKIHGTNEKAGTAETSPLRTALSLVTSIHTLYTALPIAWMMNSFKEASGPTKSINQGKN